MSGDPDGTGGDEPSYVDPLLVEWVAEIAERIEAGEPVDLEELARRHPERAEPLRRMLPTIALMADLGASARRDAAGLRSLPGPPAPTDELGRLGDYRLLREIGRGGMGIVYEAQQVSLNRRVALKVLPFAAAMDHRHHQRFRIEAQAAAALHHTNIVPVFAIGSERGTPFYAMQLIEGRSLAALIRELRHLGSGGGGEAVAVNEFTISLAEGRFAPAPAAGIDGQPPSGPGGPATRPGGAHASTISAESSSRGGAFRRTAARLALQAAEALEHAHRRGVLHRDIKPSNLLVDELGDLWVTDFGLARLQDGSDLTLTGDLLGTLRYMSPEQARGRRVLLDGRTDVYSLGVTLYELLTLRPAFAGGDRQEILRRVALEEPIPPRRHVPAIPVDLETIVLRAMAKDPADRYATAQDLADDLRRFLEHRPIRARRPSLRDRATKWARRHRPIVATAIGILLAATVALAVAGWWMNAVLRGRNEALEEALARADRSTREAQRQRALAEHRERLAGRHLHAGRLRQAQRELEAGSIRRAQELLEGQRPGPGEPDHRGFAWSYLQRLAHRDATLLRGHQAAVMAVAATPDGDAVISGGIDGSVVVWDAKALRARASLQGDRGQVHALALSPDGTLFAAACGEEDRGGEVLIGEVRTGRRRASVARGSERALLVTFSADGRGLAVGLDYDAGSPDRAREWQLWDLADGPERARLRRRARGLSELAFSPDGRRLATALPSDGSLTIREMAADGPPVASPRTIGRVNYLALGPGGHTMAAAIIGDLSLVLWDVDAGRELARHLDLPISAHAFSPDGRWLAVGQAGGTVSILDLAGGKRAVLQDSLAQSHALAFAPDGRTLASGGNGLPGRLWDVASGRLIRSYAGETGTVHDIAFTPDDRDVILGCRYPEVHLWHREPEPDPPGLKGHDDEVWGVAFSPDGRTLASASNDTNTDATIKLWDLASGRAREVRKGHSATVSSLAFSPDGRTLATGSLDSRVKLWDVATAHEHRTFLGHTAQVRSVSFAPDGRTLASAGSDRTVRLWDTLDGHQIALLEGHTDKVRSVAFSPDGRTLASGGNDQSVRLWDMATGGGVRALRCPHHVIALAFSPDGRTLASSGEEGRVVLWDPTSGDHILTLTGPGTEARGIAFAPDGQTLAVGYKDHTIRLWDSITGQEQLILQGHVHWVNTVAFSPDGRTLASGSHDGALQLWYAGPG